MQNKLWSGERKILLKCVLTLLGWGLGRGKKRLKVRNFYSFFLLRQLFPRFRARLFSSALLGGSVSKGWGVRRVIGGCVQADGSIVIDRHARGGRKCLKRNTHRISPSPSPQEKNDSLPCISPPCQPDTIMRLTPRALLIDCCHPPCVTAPLPLEDG